MTTKENNGLLARFLGWWETESNYLYSPYHEKAFLLEELSFHTDWNWLMLVVDKIETTPVFGKLPELFIMYDNRLEFLGWYWSIEVSKKFEKDCLDREESRIVAVYNACIEFVRWYNKQEEHEAVNLR